MNQKELRVASALVLGWNSRPSDVSFEAFRPWVLTSLKLKITFDGAIWGQLSQSPLGRFELHGVHVQGIAATSYAALESLWPLTTRPDSRDASEETEVSNFCLADPSWKTAEHRQLRQWSLAIGLSNCLIARARGADSVGHQVVMLTRLQALHRFTANDAAQFEFFAPHMMQSFSIRRQEFLDEVVAPGGASAVLAAAAIVDSQGYVHDQHSRFVNLLRREWSDWPGLRLPEPLLELTARRAGTNWRFLGSHVAAEFLAVQDVYVVTARPRRRADQLTAREGEVAGRYAAGGSFREVAESLKVSPATVRTHLRNVYGKLQIRNRSQLAALLR